MEHKDLYLNFDGTPFKLKYDEEIQNYRGKHEKLEIGIFTIEQLLNYVYNDYEKFDIKIIK